MFFSDNPFYILSLHTKDGKEAISTALQEKLEKAKDKKERNRLLDAEYDLTHSRRRSSAEFFWLPLLTKKEAYGYIDDIISGKPAGSINFPCLSSIVLAVNCLYYGAYEDPLPLFLKICEDYGKIDPIATAALFNEDRRSAGLAGTYDYSHVEMCERDLLENIGEAACKVKERAGKEKWTTLISSLAEKEKETIPGADLLLSYEDSMREEKREKEKDIDYALTLTRTHFPQGLSLAKEKINDWMIPMKPMVLWQGARVLMNLFHRLRNEEIYFLSRGEKDKARELASLFRNFEDFREIQEIRERDGILISHGLIPERQEIHFPRFDRVPGTAIIPEAPEIKKKKLFGIFPF